MRFNPNRGRRVMAHQIAARPVQMLVASIVGITGLACVIGGMYGIFHAASSPTTFELGGMRLTTGHVGVAFVGIGLLVELVLLMSVLRNELALAGIKK